jgi:hypothetical protein
LVPTNSFLASARRYSHHQTLLQGGKGACHGDAVERRSPAIDNESTMRHGITTTWSGVLGLGM